MKRTLLVMVAAVLGLLWWGDFAWAQEGPANGNPPDTFPATLGYAALTIISTAGAAMSGVIAKLWKAQRDQDKAHASQLEGLSDSHRKTIEAINTECRKQIDGMNQRLEQEQRERREEAERLLREQKEIMREVMVTCSAISVSLEKNTEALVKLESMIQQWGDE